MNKSLLVGRKAFSLIEVVVALGIVAFVLTGLLATFPAGLAAEGASQHETRATQCAHIVLGMLQSAPFNAVPCFGEELDLSQLDSRGAGSTLMLHAAISAEGEVIIERTLQEGVEGGDYTLQLHFEPRLRGGRVEASAVSLSITPRTQPERAFHFNTIVGNFGA